MLIDPIKINIQSGDETLFVDYETGGEMWTQEGHREARHRVQFTPAFDTAPVVHVGISLFDFAAHTAVRAEIVAEHVSATGFDLVFKTWSDTQAAQARANWLAIGQSRTGTALWDLNE